MRLLSKVLWFLWYRVLRYLVMVPLAPIVWFYIGLHKYELEIGYYTVRACQGVANLGRAIAGVTYLLGGITTVGLLGTSTMTLIYIVSMEIGLPMPKLQAYYEVATRIFDNKSAWAAATIAIATTVALFHLKNLEVNRERHFAEMRDRWKAEEEERKKRRNELTGRRRL